MYKININISNSLVLMVADDIPFAADNILFCSRRHFILQQKIIRSRHKHIIFYAHAGAMQHLPDEVFLLSKNLSEKSFKKNILTTFLQIKYQYVLEINYQ